jgi:hypothetical protein
MPELQVETLTQEAPYPEELADLVANLKYRPHWTFRLDDIDRGQGSKGLTFIVTSQGYDTYNPERGETYRVHHYFPVPPAAFVQSSWQRWILDRLIEIETHEVCEFMQIGASRPFAPIHAPGHDPYVVREMSRQEDVETTYKGDHRKGSQD